MSLTETTYAVTGMTCGHCRQAVLDEVRAVPGVEAAEVDLAAGTLTVQADGVTVQALRAAVDEAGYELVA